jgi:hypothetical protein
MAATNAAYLTCRSPSPPALTNRLTNRASGRATARRKSPSFGRGGTDLPRAPGGALTIREFRLRVDSCLFAPTRRRSRVIRPAPDQPQR